MRRKRIQEEGRQQAQDLLESGYDGAENLANLRSTMAAGFLELAGHS